MTSHSFDIRHDSRTGRKWDGHERAARILAAELSEKGEEDWRRYLPLARQVSTRVDDDFRRIFGRPDADR